MRKGKNKHIPSSLVKAMDGESMKLKEEKRACRCSEKKSVRDWEEAERGGGWGGREKAGLGNYWTRLGSWGNLSGTGGPRWWGCGRQDHMEGGLWLCSLKLMTRLLPSPWAECEMRLARPNVLHMHHLCHKTNLITVNYGTAIIRRGPCHTYTHGYMQTQIHTHTITFTHIGGATGFLKVTG